MAQTKPRCKSCSVDTLSLSANSPFINFGTYENLPANPKTTYVQQWSLSIQRQLGANWLVMANYIGNNTIHLWGGNQAPQLQGL